MAKPWFNRYIWMVLRKSERLCSFIYLWRLLLFFSLFSKCHTSTWSLHMLACTQSQCWGLLNHVHIGRACVCVYLCVVIQSIQNIGSHFLWGTAQKKNYKRWPIFFCIKATHRPHTDWFTNHFIIHTCSWTAPHQLIQM